MRLLACFIITSLLIGCGGDADDPASNLPAPDTNVLFIVVDTMGAQYLGDHNPNIGRLAAEGVAFTRAYATAPWTQPSIASMLTSQMPSQHGVRHIFHTLDRGHTTLAEHMKQRGLRTAGVISHFVIGDEFGYGQGFDRYNAEAVGNHRAITSDKVTDLAMASLDVLREEPFFLFVHYFDPHWYFNHHPQFDQTAGYDGELLPGMDIADLRARRGQLEAADIAYLEGLYREEIAYTDHHIGRLLDHLASLGLADDTVIVLTADHGEEFMQHGWIGHTASLHDELIHVPLIVHAPGRYAPQRVDEPVSTLDIAPTLLDLQGMPASADHAGVSLAPLLRGEGLSLSRFLFAEVSYISPSGWPSGDGDVKRYYQTAVVNGTQKLIHDHLADTWHYYDLATDAGEQSDLFRRGDAAQRPLLDALHSWQVDHTAGWNRELREELTIDPEAARQLRALGYVH